MPIEQYMRLRIKYKKKKFFPFNLIAFSFERTMTQKKGEKKQKLYIVCKIKKILRSMVLYRYIAARYSPY